MDQLCWTDKPHQAHRQPCSALIAVFGPWYPCKLAVWSLQISLESEEDGGCEGHAETNARATLLGGFWNKGFQGLWQEYSVPQTHHLPWSMCPILHAAGVPFLELWQSHVGSGNVKITTTFNVIALAIALKAVWKCFPGRLNDSLYLF